MTALEKVQSTEIGRRITANKNPFWKKARIVGAVIAGIGTIIVSAPITIPVGIVSVATYLIVVGGTITSVAQLTEK